MCYMKTNTSCGTLELGMSLAKFTFESLHAIHYLDEIYHSMYCQAQPSQNSSLASAWLD